jgi:hypothetical protein
LSALRRYGLRSFAAIAFVAAAGLFAACGGGGPSTAPGLALDAAAFDLGEVPVDQTVERTVSFANDGQEPLKVSIVKVRPAPNAACGCGVEGSEVRPEVVDPGQRGELVFKLRAPEGMPNMQDIMLAELASNDPDQPSLTISLVFQMAP